MLTLQRFQSDWQKLNMMRQKQAEKQLMRRSIMRDIKLLPDISQVIKVVSRFKYCDENDFS